MLMKIYDELKKIIPACRIVIDEIYSKGETEYRVKVYMPFGEDFEVSVTGRRYDGVLGSVFRHLLINYNVLVLSRYKYMIMSDISLYREVKKLPDILVVYKDKVFSLKTGRAFDVDMGKVSELMEYLRSMGSTQLSEYFIDYAYINEYFLTRYNYLLSIDGYLDQMSSGIVVAKNDERYPIIGGVSFVDVYI